MSKYSEIPFLVSLLLLTFAIEANCQTLVDTKGPVRGQPISLFDGTSLDGWVRRNGKPAPKGWVIEDGTLHRKERSGDLYYNSWFENFDLTFEWKIEKGGNSGVKYRVQDYGKQSLGCEYQLQDDNKYTKTSAGSIYALYAPDEEKRKLNAVGEWNQSRIVVCGQNVEHWLNGELIVTAKIGSSDWLERVAESKFSDKAYFGQNRWGRIFLQDHGNPVWFRNIVITPLICNEQIEFTAPQEQQWIEPSSFEYILPVQEYRMQPYIPCCPGF